MQKGLSCAKESLSCAKGSMSCAKDLQFAIKYPLSSVLIPASTKKARLNQEPCFLHGAYLIIF
ncbi:hypothetical protein [Rummeliibacillus sp. POC4]|uniref:hypothetical protein n=1 Tax=Rummeliibacillus sp. POC4 TaxID=2305899 RepID=UPI000E672E03|nr:hypothetical protein [Rummeliibacillus sp. POC4]RIJ67959.1 hypothetical protein D1606_03460 [Rummeliibacillus sp. POC4]